MQDLSLALARYTSWFLDLIVLPLYQLIGPVQVIIYFLQLYSKQQGTEFFNENRFFTHQNSGACLSNVCCTQKISALIFNIGT